jgi:hypothetical protein
MLDTKFATVLVELMASRSGARPESEWPVSELFSVIGQYFGDPDWACHVHIAQEPTAIVVAAPALRSKQCRGEAM